MLGSAYNLHGTAYALILVPIIQLLTYATDYVVQGHRFDIIEVIGCRPDFYVSIASIFLQTLPPLIITVLTFIYAGLALLHFFRRRMIFTTHLSNSASGLTPSRYFRLMLMAVAEMVMGLTITALDTWSNYQYGTREWISWANVHSNFSRVGQYPWIAIPQSGRTWNLGMWWTVPLTSVLFFAFFGFGDEAVKEYKKCGAWIRRVVFRQGEKGSLGMSNIGSEKGYLKKAGLPRKLRLLSSDASSFKTESTAFSPNSTTDRFSPLPSYKKAQSMTNKPSLASLLDKPLPGYPVLDIRRSPSPARADPMQTLPASPTLLTLSQEFDSEFDAYSLYAQTSTPSPGTPTVADSDEAHDDHHEEDKDVAIALAHTADIV